MEGIAISLSQLTTSMDIRKYNLPIASDSQRQLLSIVNYVFLCGIISLFGIITNIINMLIFCRQGLTTTINISFFAMAVADLCSLLVQQWFNVFINPFCVDLDWPIVYTDVQYMVAAIPREVFARITCLITVYITAERCLCIAFPLHVKQMITPRRTLIVIVFMFSLPVLYASPLYFTSYIGWTFDLHRNKTLQSIVVAGHYQFVQDVSFFFHGTLGLISFQAVVVFTLILIRKLGQKSVWREAASAHQDRSMSKKDRSTMIMVTLIASILIACYFPSVALSVTTLLVPEFSVIGRFYNIFYITWSFALLLENINSSVNIFLYYKMSSKFRKSFQEMFHKCCFPTNVTEVEHINVN